VVPRAATVVASIANTAASNPTDLRIRVSTRQPWRGLTVSSNACPFWIC
jgi:hypothetical protein